MVPAGKIRRGVERGTKLKKTFFLENTGEKPGSRGEEIRVQKASKEEITNAKVMPIGGGATGAHHRKKKTHPTGRRPTQTAMRSTERGERRERRASSIVKFERGDERYAGKRGGLLRCQGGGEGGNLTRTCVRN